MKKMKQMLLILTSASLLVTASACVTKSETQAPAEEPQSAAEQPVDLLERSESAETNETKKINEETATSTVSEQQSSIETVSKPPLQTATKSTVKTVAVAAPVRRYFRPTATETPMLPKIVTVPSTEEAVVAEAETVTAVDEVSPTLASDEGVRRFSEIRVVDRSLLLKNVQSDSFYFSAMVFNFDTADCSAQLQFEHVPNRSEFAQLSQEKLLFETFFPSEEFASVAEKSIAVAGGGIGFEVEVRALSESTDALETLAALLSLLLQRPIEVGKSGSVGAPICAFSFACDPVMSFSSPNSYGMYTNAGGERVSLSFNLQNDTQIRFRLAY